MRRALAGMWRSEGNLMDVSPLFPSRGLQGSTLGCQTWQQVPSPVNLWGKLAMHVYFIENVQTVCVEGWWYQHDPADPLSPQPCLPLVLSLILIVAILLRAHWEFICIFLRVCGPQSVFYGWEETLWPRQFLGKDLLGSLLIVSGYQSPLASWHGSTAAQRQTWYGSSSWEFPIQILIHRQ